LQRSFNEEIWAAIIGVIVIALACDFLLVVLRRVLTPWSRGRGRPQPGQGEPAGAEQAVLAEGMAR
jgi:hypothetical protein